ncbi:MAG TPA: GHKL domain-containing protein [Bacillales bacterium]|nr:GHKL domain-containing protein [Bacillales bacterium]
MFITNKLFGNNQNQANRFYVLLTALLTTFAGEFRLVPYEGDAFRFGLGSIIFFLLILVRPPAVSLIRIGVVTGITVVCFRMIEDFILYEVLFSKSLLKHVAAFLFYFIYALGLHIIKIEKYKTFPLILGAWASVFEVIANGTEHFVRHLLLDQPSIELKDFALLSGVALLRSYFVVGLYGSITVSEQKKRVEELLKVGSDLYGETLYLQKSMNHIEKITAESHDLYRKLKQENLKQLSAQALHIAQEIHEVKKDSQRILAGLTKIGEQKMDNTVSLSDLMNLVISANEKYSELLQKKIVLNGTISSNYQTDQLIPLLALLNNITANAVEAIHEKGEIDLKIYDEQESTFFVIADSGPGIPKADLPTIFEPGYTTKFNDRGVAATGIGLSHVQEIVHTLQGQVEVDTSENGTIFKIKIPTTILRK